MHHIGTVVPFGPGESLILDLDLNLDLVLVRFIFNHKSSLLLLFFDDVDDVAYLCNGIESEIKKSITAIFLFNMAKKILTIDQQIEKISFLESEALKAVESEDLIKRIGAVTVFAGLADFLAIQAARLLEQVWLKVELAQNQKPVFQLHPDSYFYDERVSTRTIIKEFEKFFPFKIISDIPDDEQKLYAVAKAYLKSTERFLNYRNTLLHHIGSPKVTESKIEGLILKSIDSYEKMIVASRVFFEAWQSYRLSTSE